MTLTITRSNGHRPSYHQDFGLDPRALGCLPTGEPGGPITQLEFRYHVTDQELETVTSSVPRDALPYIHLNHTPLSHLELDVD